MNNSVAFSILADETADIGGKEQMSLCVRFANDKGLIKEEFLGFTALQEFDAKSLAHSILEKCSKLGLNMAKIVGQGYDGCSVMAGKEAGVQAIIKRLHPRAAFFHCASHKLNLVINDLNAVPAIRNSIGSIKTAIKFFRDSPKRRALVPNIPLLCETRWTAKYQSIRFFKENFVQIFEKICDISECGKSGREAYQLMTALSTSTFLVSLVIIAYYAAMLEPIAQMLQSVQLDILKANEHVQAILSVIRLHRTNACNYFSEIFSEVDTVAKKLNLELRVPRTCGRQKYRSNFDDKTVEDYFRHSIFIPYLDSLISSLECRFSSENKMHFNLFLLCPDQMTTISRTVYRQKIAEVGQFFDIDNLEAEALTWYDLWQLKPPGDERNIESILRNTDFFPSIKKALLIALALPVSTSTPERTFSTLRRVKTWLRSTMCEDRLSGLCMLSVHRTYVKENKEALIKDVINKFGADRRRLQFLFKS